MVNHGKLLLGLLLTVVCVVAAGQFEAIAAPNYDRSCGLMPGDGAFGFVRAKDTTCRHAWKVTRKARVKFCHENNDCTIDWETDINQIYRGITYRNGWRCKVMVGWEIYRVKCRRGQMIVIGRGGA